ncbi:MAG: hypothetical protein GF355_07950, partial [Candidatus Eisenbacteria bacterium]|nr:hypothetical protein [Candidatus Eisenbacteria bacterium]
MCNPHFHSIVPDGLWVADGPPSDGSSGSLRFEPLPAPTTADVEGLTVEIARRLTEEVAAQEADGSDYLDPELAALCEAYFFSRTPPLESCLNPRLAGLEEEEEDPAEGLAGKPLCASAGGFSLHAARSVAADDREALEQLLRYGLRAPFSQERLSRGPEGKVVYRLRRPWPNPRGATHLTLDPLDFLRRLAALVSYPYA